MPAAAITVFTGAITVTTVTTTSETTAQPIYVAGIFHYAMPHRIVDFHPDKPVMAVKLAAWRRDLAEQELADAVHSARARKVSWREVGDALGTSGEAARQRYGAA
jgi:hypothetical protein